MSLQDLPEIYDLVNGRDLVTAGPDLSVREGARLMRENAIGAIIVCAADGAVIGIFTERDLLNRVVAEDRDAGAVTLGEVMTKDPETLDLRQSLAHALDRMIDARFRHLPVVETAEDDARPVLVGVISARDILRVFKDRIAAQIVASAP